MRREARYTAELFADYARIHTALALDATSADEHVRQDAARSTGYLHASAVYALVWLLSDDAREGAGC